MAKIKRIDPEQKRKIKQVAIYCRVSSTKKAQLKSVTAQISALTKAVFYTPNWKLYSIYIDICSGKDTINRSEFLRLVDDCAKGKIDIVYTKSVSRFGRDTVDVLSAFNQLRDLGIEIIFEAEGLKTDNDPQTALMISLYSAVAQSENESRSRNIKRGIEMGARLGTSKLYSKRCYGYEHNKNGNLIIKESEAEVVRLIYDHYLLGDSIIGIKRFLESNNYLSPSGNSTWCKKTIENILSNEKYTGDSHILDPREAPGSRYSFIAHNHHPAIIPMEQFEAVKLQRQARSSFIATPDGKVPKGTKYSSKRK